MNNEIKKIKAALKRKAVDVAVFDSTKQSKEIPTNSYVLLEDALKAIDDVEITLVSPPCSNFSGAKRKCDHVVVTNTGDKPSYCMKCGETFGTHHST